MDIPAERNIIQLEETAPQAAVSEAMMTRVGATLNHVNTRQLDQCEFNLNGAYNILTPNYHVDGIITFPFAFEITHFAIFNASANGSSGTTELDVKWAADGSTTWASICSVTPKFTPSAAAMDVCWVGQTKTGFTAPVMSKTTFAARDKLRIDLMSAVAGTVDGCGIKIFWRPI